MTPAEQLSKSKPRKERKPAVWRRVWQCSVREERERLHLSIREVAATVGISTTVYACVEHGGEVKLTAAWKLAEFFGKPIDELWRKP